MLYQANCFDVMGSLPDNSVDAIITDPPYATTACRWDTPIDLPEYWKQAKRLLKTPKSPVVMFADQPFTSALVMSNPKWFRYEWLWDKHSHSGFLNAWKRPLKHTEDIVVFSEKTPNYNIQQHLKPTKVHQGFRPPRTSVAYEALDRKKGKSSGWTGFLKERIEFRAVKGAPKDKLHETEKPIDLMEFLVGLYTNEGDVVLDPFMGSGTTGVACKNLNREFIGIEKEEIFYEVALARV
jgi:site-specific DNA-methyltransferase (adenine-specific)